MELDNFHLAKIYCSEKCKYQFNKKHLAKMERKRYAIKKLHKYDLTQS